MDKASEMGQTSATGSVQLFVGQFLSTIVLAISTIVLGIFILQSDYGLYMVAFVPASICHLFQDLGTGPAIVKNCAQCRAENKGTDLRNLILAGVSFAVLSGAILTIMIISLSSFLASTVFNKPASALLIVFASITILSTALISISQNVFVGFEKMKFSSYTMIFQAFVQGISATLLVYFGYGALGAVLGYTLASTAASVLSLLFLYFGIFKKLPARGENQTQLFLTLKKLLKYGIPLAIGGILAGGLSQFTNFIIASFYSSTLIGNYRIALNFAVLLTFFTIPITTVLFPAFSKLNPQNERSVLKSVFTSSIKYASIFVVPVTLATVVISHSIIYTIYGAKWVFAPDLLILSIIGNLFVILGMLSVTSFLQALGETKTVMKLNALTLVVGIPASYFVARMFGLYWMLFTIALIGVPSLIIGLRLIQKRFDAKIDIASSVKVLLSTSVVAVITYFFLNSIQVAVWIQLLSGLAVFLVLYLIALPLSGAINQMDIANLRGMFRRLGLVSKILNIMLSALEKVLNLISQIKRKE